MIFAVDFDGTCVKHRFPLVGEPIGSEFVLKPLYDNGHKIILFTMRSHPLEGANSKDLTLRKLVPTEIDTLQDAVNWFKDKGIELYGVNENPSQYTWTQSQKPYANIYIDDAALGCPMREDLEGNAFVDWIEVANRLCDIGCITPDQRDSAVESIEKMLSVYD